MDQLVQNEQHQDNQNQINLNLNEQEQIQKVQDAPNQIEEKPQQIQITRGSDTFSLPAILAAQKDATEFLGKNFAKKNEKYINKAAYKQDTDLINKYYDRTRMELKLTYKQRAKKENDLVNAEFYKLGTDNKFGFCGDNKEMREVKAKLVILQNVLSGDMQAYTKEITKMEATAEGGVKEVKKTVVDAAKFGETIDAAFETTITACETYIQTHPSPSSWWGKRRKRRCIRLRDYLRRELFKYKASVKSLESGAYEGKLFSTLKSPQDLVEKLDVITIENAELQRQGNSMDVYVVQVEEVDEKGNPTMVTYYMKENLPLINQNISSFLDRRIEQLEVSKDHKKKGNTQKEELRLQTSGIDDTDYENGLSLLRIMKQKIASAGLAQQEEVKKHYVEFFRHDFDSVFKNLRAYNANVDRLNKLIEAGQKIELAEWEQKAATDPVAGIVLEALRNRQTADVHEKLAKETPFSWIKKQLALDETKDTDKEIVKLLEKMEKEQPLNVGAKAEQDALSRIETLFRITMGKEVELFGQIMEGEQNGENEMSQYNTMVTSYLAQRYGFKEVVNTTMRNANFTRGNDTKASGAPVTMQEAAPGDEWIELIKDTRDHKPGVVIKQSSNSVRQLLRLQMFDTLCLQKDRHGRNFKCVHEQEGNVEVVKTTKAYDHDQSFYASSMKDAFKEETDAKGNVTKSSKNRFLPATMKVVKKGSSMYKYIAKKYFNQELKDPDWISKVKEPTFTRTKNGELQEFKLNTWMKDHLFLSMLGGKKGKNGESLLPESADLDTYIKQLEKDEDVSVTDRNFEKYIVRRDKPDEKIVPGTKTYLEVLKKLNDIVKDVADFYLLDEPDTEYADKKVEERKKNPEARGVDYDQWLSDLYINRKPDLTKLPKLAARMGELKELSDTYDLKNMYVLFQGALTLNLRPSRERILPNGETKMMDYGFEFKYDVDTRMTGEVAEAWIHQILYTFVKSYGNNPDIQNELASVGKPKEFAKLENENGDLVVPGLLHADLEAKQELENIVHDFEHGNLREIMLQEQMTEDAVTATYQRAKEQLARLEEMRVKAEVFLGVMYADLPENDPHRQFYLKPEDYDKFDDLSEFAVDPGDSYLVQDNEHFLACQEEYQKYMTEEEKQSVLEERNAVLSDSKRWKDKKTDQLTTNISSSIHKKDGQEAKKNWQRFAKNKVDHREADHLSPEKEKIRKERLYAKQLAALNKDLDPLKKQSEKYFKNKLEQMKLMKERNEAIKKAKLKRWTEDCDAKVKKYNDKIDKKEDELNVGYGDLLLKKDHAYVWMDEYKSYAAKAEEQHEHILQLESLYRKELDEEETRVTNQFLDPYVKQATEYFEKEMKPILVKWDAFYPKYRELYKQIESEESQIQSMERDLRNNEDVDKAELERLKQQLEEHKKAKVTMDAEHEILYKEMKEVLEFDYKKRSASTSLVQARLREKFLPEDASYSEISQFDDRVREFGNWSYSILKKSNKKKQILYGGY